MMIIANLVEGQASRTDERYLFLMRRNVRFLRVNFRSLSDWDVSFF
jgi:hypothetical protein